MHNEIRCCQTIGCRIIWLIMFIRYTSMFFIMNIHFICRRLWWDWFKSIENYSFIFLNEVMDDIVKNCQRLIVDSTTKTEWFIRREKMYLRIKIIFFFRIVFHSKIHCFIINRRFILQRERFFLLNYLKNLRTFKQRLITSARLQISTVIFRFPLIKFNEYLFFVARLNSNASITDFKKIQSFKEKTSFSLHFGFDIDDELILLENFIYLINKKIFFIKITSIRHVFVNLKNN